MGKKNKADGLGISEEITKIRDEAREGFDFRARLAGANNRRKTVTIYTDAAAGDELGYAFDATLPGGIKTGDRHRKGLVGKLDALEAESKALLAHFDALEAAELEIPDVDQERVKEITAEIAKVREEIDVVRERIKHSAFEFHLISLPEIADRKAKREARQALNLKVKGIPEARQEEYDLEHAARIISASVESWIDVAEGEKHDGLTPAQVHDLRDYLPRGQFPRLESACVELSFEAAIMNASVDDADF